MAAGDGLISMTPTSIAYSGTSAGINADGGVDFSAVTSLSLNGVFTGDYDNYLIVGWGYSATNSQRIDYRLRASGTDASGTDYARQRIEANGASVTAIRGTAQAQAGFLNLAINPNGFVVHMYGPFLVQPTASRSVIVSAVSGGYIVDSANTHSLSTSFDGITVIPEAYAITGNIHVFGYEE